jgi:enoyl-CoA hydratase/carnithine racemase
MPGQTVLIERRGAIALLSLNRPDQANALDAAMLAELADAERELADDESVRVVVVTGAGRHFCGGVDLRAAALESPWKAGVHIGFDLVRQPIIGAINGSARGGGCEIALACDFRIMSATASIGLPEVQFGELPLGGGTARLARIVGVSAAKRMIMMGEALDAAEALRIGLVDEIAQPDDLLSTTMALATRLAELAPFAVQTAKYLIDRSVESDMTTALELERRMVASMATPEERAQAQCDAAARSPVYARLLAAD